MPSFSIRLNDATYAKFMAILDHVGIGAFQEGDNRSEKFRSLIEILHTQQKF